MYFNFKKILVLCGLLFVSAFWAQTNMQAIKVSSKLITAEKFLGIDYNGNYLYTESNKLMKTDSLTTITYNNLNQGNLFFIDFNQPLKTLLHYKNFNKIVILDSQFNETYNLKPKNILPECVALASANEIWFYDSLTQKFGLLNTNTETINFTSNTVNTTFKHFFADYNFFYWIDNTYVLFQINRWGNITSLGTLPNFNTISINSPNTCVFSENNQLFWYNITTQEKIKLNITENFSENFFYKDQKLAIFTNFQINHYILK